MIRIYLAAHFYRQYDMCERAERLTAAGCTITSRWLWERGPSIPEGPRAAKCAKIDLEDIDRSDVLVVESDEEGAGRHIEFGYALAKGKPIVVIGWHESVFHHLPGVTVLPDEDALVEWLQTCPVDGSREPETPDWHPV